MKLSITITAIVFLNALLGMAQHTQMFMTHSMFNSQSVRCAYVPHQLRMESKKDSTKKSSFLFINEFSIAPGIGKVTRDGVLYQAKNEDQSVGYRMVLGQHANPYFALGIGLGVEKYTYVVLFPISLETRITLLNSKLSPVIGAGFGFAPGTDKSFGFQGQPSLGIKYNYSDKKAVVFSLGYKLHVAREDVEINYSTTERYHTYYQFLSFNFAAWL